MQVLASTSIPFLNLNLIDPSFRPLTLSIPPARLLVKLRDWQVTALDVADEAFWIFGFARRSRFRIPTPLAMRRLLVTLQVAAVALVPIALVIGVRAFS
jgi:hypothetical protein